jgi:hypothetical protein
MREGGVAMLKKLLAGVAIGAAAAVGFAIISSLSNSGTTRGNAQALRPHDQLLPLSSARAPSVVLDGLVSQARDAGVTNLATAGAAGDIAFGRSIVIGRSRSGAPEAAIVDVDGHSSFMRPAEIFRSGSLAVFSSQAGTSTTVRAASIAVFVRPEVARVTVETAGGTTYDASPVRWPTGGFASFTEVAQDPSRLPRVVRAYAASGRLLATQETRIGPMCPPSRTSCVG